MRNRPALLAIGALTVALGMLSWSGHGDGPVATSDAAPTAGANPIDDIIQRRGLTPDEVEAALEVFVPPGKFDDFVMVTSGGHRGTIMLYGIPSMRLLKEVPVYAPDSWQGWGQGSTDSEQVLKDGSFGEGLPVQTWGDLHHPQVSLTNGKYDGEWMIGTDKSSGRVAIISMRDFKPKSIYKIPNATSDHHGQIGRAHV